MFCKLDVAKFANNYNRQVMVLIFKHLQNEKEILAEIMPEKEQWKERSNLRIEK